MAGARTRVAVFGRRVLGCYRLGAFQVGGLLASLLGTKAAPAVAPAPGTVALPVTFTDGTVTVGPFKTGLRLTPLY